MESKSKFKAVIFDMYETLVTHYACELYFSAEMARDAGVPHEFFHQRWKETQDARSVGQCTFEQVVERILREYGCYTPERAAVVIEKRKAVKAEGFRHLHPQILPMLDGLKACGAKIGLTSNCFSEEVPAIRESVLFPYFDAPMLSYEQEMQKPDERIFLRCADALGAAPEECLYVGDGGSFELETAKKLGMTPMQALWYFKPGMPPWFVPMDGFAQAKTPLDVPAAYRAGQV